MQNRYFAYSFLAGLLSASLAPAAILKGVVSESASGRPLARCRVSLIMVQNGYDLPRQNALTDSAGQFRFEGLPAGTYFLAAQRSGFAPWRYGQKRWNGAGTPIVVASDTEFPAEIRLQRLGAVTGKVLDENGVGLPGTTVGAYELGSRPSRLIASAVSDDRGAYRIAGLDPGQYYVRTGSLELEDRRSLLPTFYGQNSAKPESQPVLADLDREIGNIDIQPQPGILGYLNGTLAGGAGTVWLFSETGVKQTTVSGSGEFTFEQLSPGDYEILARTPNGSRVAYQRFAIVEGQNKISLAWGTPAYVRVKVEGGEDPRRVTASLKRKGFSQELPFPQPIPSQIGGSVLEIVPGEYTASAEAGREFYVRSIRFQDAPDTSRIVALPGQGVDLVVTVSGRPAVLAGKVSGPDGQPVPGAPVFLNALDPELSSRVGGVRVARAGQDGVYHFPGLPPGEYQVFSSFEFQTPQESDWKRVPVKQATVPEGQESTLDLELSGPM